jgi:hypothetical protein
MKMKQPRETPGGTKRLAHGPASRTHRRSVRLQSYDYCQPGWYFITICTRNGEQTLQDPHINAIIEQCWHEIPNHFPDAELDAFVIMPNHIHGIIILGAYRNETAPARNPLRARHAVPLQGPDGPKRGFSPLESQSLHTAIASFKSACSRRIRRQGRPFFA